MEDCIVITRTEDSVKILMKELGKEFNNIGFWGRKNQDYDTLWIWTIRNNSYSGSSGYKCLENHISRNPKFRIVSI